MSDLVERLRNDVCLFSKLDWQESVALAREAADRITSLEAELAEARRRLMEMSNAKTKTPQRPQTTTEIAEAVVETMGAQKKALVKRTEIAESQLTEALAREAVLREALERANHYIQGLVRPAPNRSYVMYKNEDQQRTAADVACSLSTPTPAQKIIDVDETEIALRVLRDHDMLEEADKLAALDGDSQ